MKQDSLYILLSCCILCCFSIERQHSMFSCAIPGMTLVYKNDSTKFLSKTLTTHSDYSDDHHDDYNETKIKHNIKRDTTQLLHDDFNKLALNGDTVFEDAQVFRALGKFARERIPERVVHAKGISAFGTFRVTNSAISQYTLASMFQPSKVTSLVARFSTSAGELGSPDTAFGEVRGFGIKFYTEDGNFDLLGINLPIFFINDPQLFPHLMRALKRDPDSDLRTTDSFWDFISLRPESLSTVTILYTDFGLPDGYRRMPAFGVSAFKLTNGKSYSWAKFSWLPVLGTSFLNLANATKIAGFDPDYSRRDLFTAISNGDFPSWRLYFQTATNDELSTLTFDPFDATKLWSFDRFPLQEVGVLTLNRNTQNSFSENEQLALNPANLVPGIEPSPDRLHRGRFFIYRDTQFYRLGANFDLFHVNREYRSNANERNGEGRCDKNLGNIPNYYPNSIKNFPQEYNFLTGGSFRFSSQNIWSTSKPGDTLEAQYDHARMIFVSLSNDEKAALFRNLAFSFSRIKKKTILSRMMDHLERISTEYRLGVEKYIN